MKFVRRRTLSADPAAGESGSALELGVKPSPGTHKSATKNGNRVRHALTCGNRRVFWPATFPDVAIGTGFSPLPEKLWKGAIDEVMVWDRALSQDEIKLLYSSQNITKAISYQLARQGDVASVIDHGRSVVDSILTPCYIMCVMDLRRRADV